MTDCGCATIPAETAEQRRILEAALALNATKFVVETVAGVIAGSSGLIANGPDMLADASAYAVGLFAVRRSGLFEANAARESGLLLQRNRLTFALASGGR